MTGDRESIIAMQFCCLEVGFHELGGLRIAALVNFPRTTVYCQKTTPCVNEAFTRCYYRNFLLNGGREQTMSLPLQNIPIHCLVVYGNPSGVKISCHPTIPK
jgi:hypothetical protein